MLIISGARMGNTKSKLIVDTENELGNELV